MTEEPKAKRTPKYTGCKFPQITAAAKAAGVSRQVLHDAIMGKPSPVCTPARQLELKQFYLSYMRANHPQTVALFATVALVATTA